MDIPIYKSSIAGEIMDVADNKTLSCTAEEDIIALSNQITEQAGEISALKSNVLDISEIEAATEAAIEKLGNNIEDHINTDAFKWQTVADLQAQVIALQNTIENVQPDEAQAVDIETEANGDGYTVSNSLGGIITFDLYSVLLGFGEVTVTYSNGTTVKESAQGLSLIEVLHKTMKAPYQSVITCATVGVDNITFIPNVPLEGE